jgi:hypothetical protein
MDVEGGLTASRPCPSVAHPYKTHANILPRPVVRIYGQHGVGGRPGTWEGVRKRGFHHRRKLAAHHRAEHVRPKQRTFACTVKETYTCG